MSRTKFMGIFLIILGVISVVVGIVRGDMTSSAAMFIGYLVPALLGAMILIVDHIGGGESKTETGPSDAALAGLPLSPYLPWPDVHSTFVPTAR